MQIKSLKNSMGVVQKTPKDNWTNILDVEVKETVSQIDIKNIAEYEIINIKLENLLLYSEESYAYGQVFLDTNSYESEKNMKWRYRKTNTGEKYNWTSGYNERALCAENITAYNSKREFSHIEITIYNPTHTIDNAHSLSNHIYYKCEFIDNGGNSNIYMGALNDTTFKELEKFYLYFNKPIQYARLKVRGVKNV